ncbi:MAG: hypothetical protein P1U36_10145 [Legionellaceae bacterium]|nr:hypothetical protein [Legionellaceae bacterium]
MADSYEMVVRGSNPNDDNPIENIANLGDEQLPDEASANHFLGCMDANIILKYGQDFGKYICIGATVLVFTAIIFSTAFSTCTKVEIENNTGDLLFFNRVNPRGAKIHDIFTYPYSRNNATFGFGNDHISLGTYNNGRLIAYDNGDCELSNGPSNRDFKKYSLSPFFYTCYCEYKKSSSSTDNSSTAQSLRGFDDMP